MGQGHSYQPFPFTNYFYHNFYLLFFHFYFYFIQIIYVVNVLLN